MINRNKPIATDRLCWFFNELKGFYNWGNQELQGSLWRWNFLEEQHRTDEQLAYSFLKWSFTVSYLELINALQWLSAGVLLYRKAYLPAQTMQMYYYSIFFSYGSFLAAHGKGLYTVKEELREHFETTPDRRVIWFEDQEPAYLCLADRPRSNEHKSRANWFYEILKGWDKKDAHQPVLLFQNDRDYHTGERNQYTYSLFTMADELHHNASHHTNLPTVDELIRLWNRDESVIDDLPEEFWAFEHLKVPLALHIRLLDNYKGDSPFTQAQTYITETLLSRHKETGIKSVLIEILKPILERMNINAG
jgi:hypothetical protein